MACEQHLVRIQEKVDGTIGSIRRAELDMHLDECDACRALYEDLQRIHDAAADLPALAPPDGAWLQIAGRLRMEGRIKDEVPVPHKSRRTQVAWLALAAALVLAAGSAVMLLIPRTPAPAPQAASSTPSAAGTGAPGGVASVEAVNAVEAAQAQFEKAIADLEKVAKNNQQALDASTSATIEKNLGILDQAIAENRAAVKAEPASVAARETLFDALRQKVSLLQDTISLINEMRKGNNAAAAQLVNKS
jgi:tetratricopeptide (TPR) repeat protein